MKRLRYILLILVVVIIIILSLILIIRTKNSDLTPDEEEYEIPIELSKTVEVVKDRNNYYIIKNIIDSYYYDVSMFDMKEEDILVFEEDEEEDFSESIEEEIKLFKNKVYNTLDEKYIEKNGITLDNIDSKLKAYEDVFNLINDMYYIDIDETTQVYFINGYVIEKETSDKDTFSMMITIDNQNNLYEIYPDGYEYDVKLGKELKIAKKEVKNRNLNKYTYKFISEENYCIDMFKDYKNRIMYDIDSAYSILNEEYSKAKFENETEFKSYIQNNYYKLISATINNYQMVKEEEKSRYMFSDRDSNYYIFKENAPMEYEVMLDIYTIDVPEFVTKYEASNDQEKVILNINNFILSINDKDYKYAYSLLADSFKENKFKTEAEFEKYIKSNFFEKNKVAYDKFGNEASSYYTYEVTITDSENKAMKMVDKTFIVLLKDGTDFELSFNV